MELGMWLLFLSIVCWIYFVEKRTISSIGLKSLTIKTGLIGVGLGILLFVVFGVVTTFIISIGLNLNQNTAQLISSQPLPVLLLIALRAAIVEEVLYRGYAFERLVELTKSKFVSGLIPIILFMLAHLAWGPGHLIFVFFAGALFTLAYIARRNLAMVMIAHFTVDIIALLVLPILLASQQG